MRGIKDLVKSVRNDLKDEDNTMVEDILKAGAGAGGCDSSYLENRTLDDITQSIFDVINEHIVLEDNRKKYCNKLAGYRYVERVCDIRIGQHCRWIHLEKDVLHNGGTVVNIRISDSIFVLCKTPSSRYPFVTCDFNKILFFQKLTDEESFILIANKIIK
jgi:hypothetical protein